jgi:hypothetical protein
LRQIIVGAGWGRGGDGGGLEGDVWSWEGRRAVLRKLFII